MKAAKTHPWELGRVSIQFISSDLPHLYMQMFLFLKIEDLQLSCLYLWSGVIPACGGTASSSHLANYLHRREAESLSGYY